MGKWIGAVIGLVFLLGLLWFVKIAIRESSKPLPGQAVLDQGREHVSRIEWEKFKYNSDPPTSGPHDPVWLKRGIYDSPQGDGHLVHSLEHGYVIISYRCGILETDKECLSFIKTIEQRVKKDSSKLILVPRPNLDTNFALTAWGRIDKFNLKEGSLERIENFIRAFRNRGPEQTIE